MCRRNLSFSTKRVKVKCGEKKELLLFLRGKSIYRMRDFCVRRSLDIRFKFKGKGPAADLGLSLNVSSSFNNSFDKKCGGPT